MKFANASLTISRTSGTTTSTIATGVTARVQALGTPRADPTAPAMGFRYRVYFDLGTDVRMHDSLSGYNPRNLSTPPLLVVEDVAAHPGSLGYLSATAIDRRSRES